MEDKTLKLESVVRDYASAYAQKRFVDAKMSFDEFYVLLFEHYNRKNRAIQHHFEEFMKLKERIVDVNQEIEFRQSFSPHSKAYVEGLKEKRAKLGFEHVRYSRGLKKDKIVADTYRHMLNDFSEKSMKGKLPKVLPIY